MLLGQLLGLIADDLGVFMLSGDWCCNVRRHGARGECDHRFLLTLLLGVLLGLVADGFGVLMLKGDGCCDNRRRRGQRARGEMRSEVVLPRPSAPSVARLGR